MVQSFSTFCEVVDAEIGTSLSSSSVTPETKLTESGLDSITIAELVIFCDGHAEKVNLGSDMSRVEFPHTLGDCFAVYSRRLN